MAYVRKKRNALTGWEIQYYDGRGNRLHASTGHAHTREGKRKTLAEALEMERRACAKLDDRPTIIQVANRWVTMERPKWKPSHLESVRSRLELYVYPQWGTRMLDEIQPIEVSEWLQQLHGSGKAALTVRGAYQAFHTPITWAMRNGLVDADPCRGVSCPTDHNEPVGAPNSEAIRRTIYQARKSPRWQALIVLAAVTGLRRGELAGLQWGDIGDDYLVVKRAISGKDRIVGPPKSARSRRRIAISRRTMSVLDVWREVQEDNMAAVGVEQRPGHFVFTTDTSGLTPVPPTTITQWWIRHRCDPTVAFHDLRHYNVSELLSAGVDPLTVASRMGHSPDVMHKVYAHMIPERDGVAADLMESIVNRPWNDTERAALGFAPKTETEEEEYPPSFT